MEPVTRPPFPLSLRQLRAYAALSQVDAASQAEMTQPELSRLERRGDFLFSTLRRYVEGLGGTVDVTVAFGSSAFRLTGSDAAPERPELPRVREALRTLGALPTWIAPLVDGLSDAKLRQRVDGFGAFSLLEHAWHLRDVDVYGYTVRVARTLREERPSLPDVDGDALARDRDYQRRPLAPAVKALSASRRKALAALRALRADSFAREALLEGVGPVTLGALVLRWRAHDVGHRIEMERLHTAVRGTPPRRRAVR